MDAVVSYFEKLPGRIVNALSSLAGDMGAVFGKIGSLIEGVWISEINFVIRILNDLITAIDVIGVGIPKIPYISTGGGGGGSGGSPTAAFSAATGLGTKHRTSYGQRRRVQHTHGHRGRG